MAVFFAPVDEEEYDVWLIDEIYIDIYINK